MPSKIESSLSPEQFWDFCEAVAKMKGGRKGATLAQIQRLAAEWDIGYISENSAKSFRDGAFADFLAEMKADREMAQHIADAAQAGLGLDDAASKVLEKKLFTTAMKLGDNVDPETADFLTKSVERIRTSNRNARKLEADLQISAKNLEIADARLAESERKRAIADKRIATLTEEAEERARKKAELLAKIGEVKKKGGLTKESLAKIEQEAKLL